MKSRYLTYLGLTLTSIYVFSGSASAAALSWDTATGDGSTLTTGNGTWDLVGTNTVWNNAGANVAWTQTSTTVPLHTATFAAEDGTYAIALATDLAATSTTFSNSGYTLSATAARTLRLNGDLIVASGKSATVGSNVTVTRTASVNMNVTGGGQLNISGTGSRITGNSNLVNISGASTVFVGDNGLLTSPSQVVVGNTAAGGTLTVNGINAAVTLTGTANPQNLVLANATGATSTLNMVSGSISNSARGEAGKLSGLRIGSSGAGVASTGTVNLDGGILTVARVYEGNASSSSTFNFNGGTLRVLSLAFDAANFLTGLDTANVLSGGAKIDTNGVNTTIAQILLDGGGSGGMTKEGLGTLILTGANTYTGNTIVNGGKLAITAPYASLTATIVNANASLLVTTAATPAPIPSVTLNASSAIEVNVGAYNASQLACVSTGAYNANGNYTINLTGQNVVQGDITVLTYTSKTGTGIPTLGSVPPGVTGTVIDTGTAIVIDVDTPQVPAYIWSAGTGNWDTTTANWTGLTYTEGSVATFPEIAGDQTVTLTADRSPFSAEINNAATSAYTFVGSPITGSAKLVKSGVGRLTLSNSNTYTGPTSILGGAVVKTTADTTTGTITAASNASLALSGSITDGGGQVFTFTGPGLNTANVLFSGSAVQRGAIQSADGNNTWAGDISFSGTNNNRIGVQDNSILTLSGVITESAAGSSLSFRHGNVVGSDIIISGTTNSWTGTTDIFGGGGALKLGASNALPAASVIRVGTSNIVGDSTLDLNGFNLVCAGLSQVAADTAFITNTGATDSVLTVFSLSAQTFSGSITDGSTNKVNLMKDGNFVQTFTASSTYTGTTTIDGGTLALGATGTIDNSASIAIDEDAILDVSAKTTYVLSGTQPLTLRIDAAASGRVKAAALDVTTAQVTLDAVTLGEPVYVLAEYTSLTGTQFATVNAIPGYTIDYAYNGGTQIALVAGFSSWIAGTFANGTVPGGQGGPGADPDQDGVTNILEFVLNGDPTISDPSTLPDLNVTDTHFEFTYQRRDDSLDPETTQTFQYGTTLGTWNDVIVPAASGVVGVAGITITDGSPADSVKISIPKAEGGSTGRLFGRLQIVKP